MINARWPNPPKAGTPGEHEAEIRVLYEDLPERELAELASSTLAVALHRVGAKNALWRQAETACFAVSRDLDSD